MKKLKHFKINLFVSSKTNNHLQEQWYLWTLISSRIQFKAKQFEKLQIRFKFLKSHSRDIQRLAFKLISTWFVLTSTKNIFLTKAIFSSLSKILPTQSQNCQLKNFFLHSNFFIGVWTGGPLTTRCVGKIWFVKNIESFHY
jgi:hypothetical protein